MSSNRDALNAVIEAARDAEAPDAATRARLRAALMAKVAPPPPPPPPAGTAAVTAPVLGGGVVAVVALAASLVALRRDAPTRPPPPPVAAPAVNTPPPQATPPPPPVAAPAVIVRAPAGPASPAPFRRRTVVAPAAPVAAVVEVTPPAPSPPPPPAPPLEPPVLAAASASAGPARGVDVAVGLPPDLVVLAEARALLRGGDARGAFTRLERFAAEHPEAPRRTEREGARLLARCAAGEVDGREVRAFVAQHEEGPLGAAVRERCADRLPPP